MENNFGQPQSVVVLGGSSDIARALTKRLCAARAHTVVLCGRNQALLDEAAEEAKDYGASTTDTVLFDAEDVSDAARVVTEAFEKVGGNVDLVVVAVGLLGDQFAQENDAAAAASVALVNFAWPVAALAEIRRRLVAQGQRTDPRDVLGRRDPHPAHRLPLLRREGRTGPALRRNGRLPGRHRRATAATSTGRRAHADDRRIRHRSPSRPVPRRSPAT